MDYVKIINCEYKHLTYKILDKDKEVFLSSVDNSLLIEADACSYSRTVYVMRGSYVRNNWKLQMMLWILLKELKADATKEEYS